MDNTMEVIESPFAWSDLEHKMSDEHRAFLTAHYNCGGNEFYGKTSEKSTYWHF